MNRQIINNMIQSLKQVDGLSEDLIFVVDDGFVLQYVGGNLARRSQSYENAAGGRLMMVFPHCGKLLEPAIQRVLDSGEQLSLENLVCAGSEELWLDIRLAPICNGFGKNIGVMAACRDITQRKRHEEAVISSKQNWLQAVDNMPFLLAVIDSRHRVERINAAMARQLQIPVNQAKGLICYEHLHGSAQPPAFCPLIKRTRQSAEFEVEVVESHLGHAYLVTVTTLRDQHGRPSGCVFTARGRHDAQTAADDRGMRLQRMQILMSKARCVVAIQNQQGEYLFFRSIPEDGLVGEEIIGKTPVDLFEPQAAAKQMGMLRQVFASGREAAQSNAFSWDGETARFMEQMAPIKDPSGEINAVITFSTRMDEPRISDHGEKGTENCDPSPLTKRECEILKLIASGFTNQQIAESLYISKKTVDTHRSRIMQKLDVHKASALVRYAIDAQIL